MDTVEDYVQKHGIESLVEKIQEFNDASIEQHKLPRESKVVSVEDWFEFLWSMEDALSAPVVEFNYIEVENKAVEYVKNSDSVDEEELFNHVTSEVQSADKEEVRDWLCNLTFSTAEFNEDDEITDLGRSFDDAVY